MKVEYTLRELIETKTAASYYGTIPDRFAIANAFIEWCKGISKAVQNRGFGDLLKINVSVACLNLDNIRIIVEEENGRESYFIVPYDITEVSKDALRKTVFDNFDFASKSIVEYCFQQYEKKKEKNRKKSCNQIAGLQKKDKGVYTIAVILFHILFACHPFKDASYYSNAVIDYETELKYFAGSPSFIFSADKLAEKTPGGKAKRIEGYHKCPEEFWKKISDKQRALFVKVLLGEMKEKQKLEDFLAEWQEAFQYTTAELRALCGEEIPALIFNDKSVLIATDIMIWKNAAKCVYCNKEIKSKCKDCKYFNTGIVEVTFIDMKVTVSDGAIGKKATNKEEKTLTLYAGLPITGKALDAKNGGEKAVFIVIPTKIKGLLGLEYLGEDPIIVQYSDGTEFIAKPGFAKFKIEKGTVIYVSPNITLEIGCNKDEKPDATKPDATAGAEKTDEPKAEEKKSDESNKEEQSENKEQTKKE